MTILVVGAGGLLGSNVTVRADERGGVVGTYHSSDPGLKVPTRQLDIRDEGAVESIIAEVSPSAVVNCAAMTDVDDCESDPEKAHSVNGQAPEHLAEVCAGQDIDIVHVSTDYVFDGESETPYVEDDQTNPIQEYGRSKLTGEQAVREVNPESLVVRLSFVYGIHRGTRDLTGFPAWVVSRLETGEETPLFTDQHITPSRAGQSATLILSLLEGEATGLYHAASRSCVTPYEFGQEILHRMDAPERLIVEGSMDEVDRPAKRPPNTCLDVSRLEDRLGEAQPTLATDLDSIREVFD